MSVEKDGTTVDPFDAFRKMRDTYLESMSKVMIDAVNSEEYAQTTGALLNNYLTVSAPFREAMDKAMAMALEQLSLPSRQQVTGLAERLSNLEVRIDDMDAKLDQLIKLAVASQTPPHREANPGRRPSATNGKLHRAKR